MKICELCTYVFSVAQPSNAERKARSTTCTWKCSVIQAKGLFSCEWLKMISWPQIPFRQNHLPPFSIPHSTSMYRVRYVLYHTPQLISLERLRHSRNLSVTQALEDLAITFGHDLEHPVLHVWHHWHEPQSMSHLFRSLHSFNKFFFWYHPHFCSNFQRFNARKNRLSLKLSSLPKACHKEALQKLCRTEGSNHDKILTEKWSRSVRFDHLDLDLIYINHK